MVKYTHNTNQVNTLVFAFTFQVVVLYFEVFLLLTDESCNTGYVSLIDGQKEVSTKNFKSFGTSEKVVQMMTEDRDGLKSTNSIYDLTFVMRDFRRK